MLKLSKKIEYALIVLKYVSTKPEGELTTAKEVCQKFSTPFDTTAKVMQLMNQKGILISKQGVYGGYFLERNLNAISFLELTRLIEGDTPSLACLSSDKTCDQKNSCNIVTPMQQLNHRVSHYLTKLSLQELFHPNEHN